MKKAGRHTLYGNQNGLPGLPKTSYITRKPIRAAPRTASRMPPQTAARAPPRPRTQYHQQPPPQMMMAPPPPLMPAGPDPFVTRRMDMLEQRLNSSEQANRALMDDLMRLQQDMKMQIKKNEMGLGEERESKGRIELAMRQSQGQQYEMDDRIRRAEEAIKENRVTLQQLTGHVSSLEKLSSSVQAEQTEKANTGNNKLTEFRHDVLKVSQETEQLERYCNSLREDNKMVQNQMETVKKDVFSLQSNVKLQGRLLEDNAKAPPKTNSKNNDSTNKMADADRIVLEGKMASLNNTILDLTSRLSSEAKKREKIENDFNVRINEMASEFGKTKVEKDKELREVDDKMKELQSGFSQTEKQRIVNEISTVANDLQRKMDQKESKLRNDTVNKLTVIEKTLNDETKRRQNEEKELNDKVDQQIKSMEMKEEGSSGDLKKVFDKLEDDTRDRIGDVTSRMNDMEDMLRKHKLENERVLKAEINERHNEDKAIDSKIDDVDERLVVGLKTLQVSIGEMQDAGRGVTGSKEAQAEAAKASEERLSQLATMQEANEKNIREEMTRDMNKLDERLHDVETNLKQQDGKIENEMKAARENDKDSKEMMGDKLQQQIDGMQFNQSKLEKQVDDLKDKVQDTPKRLDTIKTDLDDLDGKLGKKIDYEAKERREADDELKDDIDRILGRRDVTVPSLAQVQTDVDATQTGMKKLAEAVHVVKTSLMDRIKDEKKLREQETTIMKRDVDRLDTKYHDIKERIKAGDVFDTEDDDFGYS